MAETTSDIGADPGSGARGARGVSFLDLRSSAAHGWVVQTASVVAGIALWEVVGRWLITNPLYFVPPSDALSAMADLARAGTLWRDVVASAKEFAIGFAVASVIGIAVGLVTGTSRTARLILDPWINALYATPLVALMPLYLIIFGIGITGKAALVVTVAVFPVLINTAVGVLTTDRSYLDVAQAYGASRWEIFSKIHLPAALPHVVSGMRLGMGRGLTGVVVGEFFFSNAGLGHLIATAGQSFDTPSLFAAIIILTAAAVVMNQALRYAERHLAPWREAA
jgi:NitT/TauT family transport system permease protein